MLCTTFIFSKIETTVRIAQKTYRDICSQLKLGARTAVQVFCLSSKNLCASCCLN